MGCLKKITKMVLFIVIVVAFFALGGFAFVKNKYDNYTKPPREILVEEERDFGDLSDISADYALSRSLNFFGYRKLNAIYLPKNQKITILDLNSTNIITEEDFSNGKLEEKLEELSSHIINSPMVPVQKIKTVRTGKIKTANKTKIPYADFEAEIKMVPVFKVKGTIALYETKNRKNIVDKIQKKENSTPKLVIACKFPNGYESGAVKKFISQIKL